MTLIIRDYVPADRQAVAAMMRAALPYLVTTPQLVDAQVTAAPVAQHFRMLVADDDGRIVGCARVGLLTDTSEPGQGNANLNVAAADRGRGIGSALLTAAERHLAEVGATTVYTSVTGDPASRSFAEHHGYRQGRSATFFRLDLAPGAPLPDPPPLPDGFTVLPAAAFADDPRPLYEADEESVRDEPGDVAADAMSYADWRVQTWDRPGFDADLTTAVVVDGVVAALAIAHTDGRERYWSGGTGTRRAYRGRGLAKAAKTHSLHLARAAGFKEAFTNNDDGNEPMLAVNRWLGYRPCGSEWRYIRDLPARA
ncbi:GNAT family N-acetyltransferase [Streptomyces sp. CA-111067]|jgi:GNAT superfamily N-acetyltransferase|uniref:GNAT family N-acetyltransferase n=1 Tax=Streptomyces sp. CA-111067 TaxID=3240046 RepID=UPI003D977885